MDKIERLEDAIYEVKNQVERYISNQEFELTKEESESIINNICFDFLNESDFNNTIIEKYVSGKFNEIKFEVNQMLEKRKEKHLENKGSIFNEKLKYVEDEDRKDNTKELLRETETPINYKEEVKRILENNIGNIIQRCLSVISIDLGYNKVEEVGFELYEIKQRITEKFSTKFDDLLINKDKRITEIVEELCEEYIKPIEKDEELIEQNNLEQEDNELSPADIFKASLTVNENGKIEKQAINNINEKEEKEENQVIGEISAYEIF